jgi:hypothetical protein
MRTLISHGWGRVAAPVATLPTTVYFAALLASLIASLSFAALAESLAVTTLRRTIPLSTLTTHANHEHCPAVGPCAEPLAQDGFNSGCRPTHSRIITQDDWTDDWRLRRG